MNIKSFIYRIAKRTLTWFGDIMLATSPPKTKAEHIIKMQQLIEPGDVICRTYTYYLDSYFIPGEYTHSGLVVDKDTMIHSVAEGVTKIHPIDFIKDTDGFVVLRPKYLDLTALQKALVKAQFHINNETQYDFLFSDPDKFYCHEFVCDCLRNGGINVSPSSFYAGIWPIKFKKTAYLASDIIANCAKVYEFI